MESVVNNNLEKVYSGKKVFVTGHTGFKGSWLITWLHLSGASVKGYALQPENEKDIFNIVSPHLNIESIIGDIRDKQKLQQEIISFQPDFIFHLAAQAVVRRSYEIPAETFEINAIGTANLLEAVIHLQKKCTVVVITTDKVYKNKERDKPYKEKNRLGGYDPYSASKACTELVTDSFRRSFFNPDNYRDKNIGSHNKALATARAGNVIGGGDWNKDRIIPDIINYLTSGRPIPVRNPGAIRPWQHVLEPLSGYLKLAALLDDPGSYRGKRFSSAYNFGPKKKDHLTVKNLVDVAINCWGTGNWKDMSDTSQPHEAGILKLDIKRAKKELKWQPKLNSKEAIQWTIDWYRQPSEMLFDYTVAQIKSYQQK
ncbi:MAG TPA: CDP-glucose 4,6-dehydratase [Chitinophagaceae bacterium]|nr:CDP-glucose 4,6-dehydratase [Chitinophagaceae bacterium]